MKPWPGSNGPNHVPLATCHDGSLVRIPGRDADPQVQRACRHNGESNGKGQFVSYRC